MFSHLHAHSEFSIADGLHSPKKWAKAYSEAGFKAAALTDHGTMSGSLQFYYSMRDIGIKPILGCEFYFVEDPSDKNERRSRHLILLAKNYDGFRNLLKLQHLSNTEGYYYRPRIGLEWLKKYSEGVICLSACLGGILSVEVWKEKDEADCIGLENRYEQFKNIFKNDFYVEFQGHDSDDQRNIQNEFIKRLKNRDGFQHVMTNDCHYIHPDHSIVQGLLKSKAYGDAATSYTTFDSLYLKDPKEIYESFSEHHEYLSKRFIIDGMKATQEIVEKCNGFELPEKNYLPKFPVKKDTPEKLFKNLLVRKLKEFLDSGELHASKNTYLERFAKEYKVITEKNMSDYFLIVWDICRFARSKNIYGCIGRGSAAGSFISFLLDIVAIDPIKYDLIFERFLNENRDELPDIDLDFEADGRQEVKDYVVNKYGADHVCEIGTYNRLRLKASITDFGKLFGYGYKELQSITTKLDLPLRQNSTTEEDAEDIESAVAQSSELRDMFIKHPEFYLVVSEIQGQIKSQSVHPAGVLISSEPISEVTPTKTQKKEKNRIIVTQSEDKFVIRQGMVKLDFLGLKEYDIIKYIIEKSDCPWTIENYVYEIEKIAWDGTDEKVWDMFSSGETSAVFQFASPGMRDLLRNMGANSLKDLIAAVALYRPGCLKNGWHDQYCRRKKGLEDVSYIHQDLESTLEKTYGVVVFQESFMEIFHKIGGIKLSDADTIRSALGKKDKTKLAKFKKEFINGAHKKLKNITDAEELWDQIEAGSSYNFNRSHSAVYAILAYISQTFKVHYTPYFWTAILEWDSRKRNLEKMIEHLDAARKMGIIPLMPDVNKSKSYFDVETIIPWHKEGFLPAEEIQPRWSLAGIQGIGPKAAIEIESKQPFTGMRDFYLRVNKSKAKWDAILNMAYSGAFDSFNDRKTIIKWLYDKKPEKEMPNLSDNFMLMKFYEVMGFFEIKIKEMYPEFSEYSVSSIDEVVDYCVGTDGIAVGGLLVSVSTLRSKNGMMGRAKLIDKGETFELNFFSDDFAVNKNKIKEGNIVIVTESKKSGYGGKNNLLDVRSMEVILPVG